MMHNERLSSDIMGLGLSYVVLLEFHGKPHNFTNVIFMTSSFSNSITQLNSDRF